MDIKQLRYFVQLYEDGKFSAAAEHLFITQQALSKSIKKLEEELGPLLSWSKNRFTPTSLGRLLYQEAAVLLQQFDQMQARIAGAAHEMERKLKLVMPFSTGDYAVDALIARFKEAHPSAEIETEVLPDLEAEKRAEEPDIDIGFCIGEPCRKEKFETTFVARRPLCLAVNVAHPLAKQQQVSLIRDVPASMLSCADERYKIYHLLCEKYAQAGLPTDFQIVHNHLMAYSRALRNECVAMSFLDVPETTAYKSLVPIAIADDLHWDISMIVRRDEALRPLAADFVRMVRRACTSGR